MTQDADSNYVTEREIQNIFSFEVTKLDKDIWPRENEMCPRTLIMEHFERLRYELLKIARRPRVHILGSDRESGTVPIPPEPTDWDSTASLESERNKQRHIEKARASRSAAMGLGRGENGT